MNQINENEIRVASPLRRHRRPLRFSQAEVARMMRVAKQIGDDHTVRVDPDGAISIVKMAGYGEPHRPALALVRDFTL